MAAHRTTSRDQAGESILDVFKKQGIDPAKIDVNKRVKIGIIGTGWIAQAHIDQYKNMPDVDIVAGADLVPGKAQAFFEKNGLSGVRVYGSHKELLDNERLDAVSVCTYNTTHAECAIYALDKGVSVLLEKPMCVTLDEAAAICRAEKRSGKLLSIGFQPRFDPNMKKIKEIVDSGVLGDIYYIQTGGGRRRGIPVPYGTSFIEKETAGIGCVGDIGCYALDVVMNAIGYPKPLTVSGIRETFFGKDPGYYKYHPEFAEKFGVDDFAAAFVRLEGGITLDFRIAWAMNIDTPCDTIILGTKAGLRIPSTECWNGTVGGAMKLYSTVAWSDLCAEIPIIESDRDDLFRQKIRSFLDAVKYGLKPPVPSSQIIRNQAIIDGIVRSSEAGREVEIDIPEL